MDVRRATVSDAGAISTVHVRSWQAAYRGLLPQSYLDDLDPGPRTAQWQSIVDDARWPGRGVLVLVDGPGVVAGFAGIGPTRDEDEDPASVGELQTLYLDPAHWRRGGGTILLAAVRRELAEAGFGSATAWVLGTNASARAFYEHHHWHYDGTTKPHDWGTFVVTDVRYRFPRL